MITMGVFGALVLRALSDDPQPMVLTMLGVVLAGLALATFAVAAAAGQGGGEEHQHRQRSAHEPQCTSGHYRAGAWRQTLS